MAASGASRHVQRTLGCTAKSCACLHSAQTKGLTGAGVPRGTAFHLARTSLGWVVTALLAVFVNSGWTLCGTRDGGLTRIG